MPDLDYRDRTIADLKAEVYSLKTDVERQKTWIVQLIEERNDLERLLSDARFEVCTSGPRIMF